MSPHPLRRYVWLAAALGAALGAAVGQADTPAANTAPPDTSGWKCEQCPFFRGYTAEVATGVLYADGANQSYDRYTGINHSGVYADVGGNGQWAAPDGAYVTYDLEDLGLSSRDATVEAGQQGRYNVRVNYDGLPSRLYGSSPPGVNLETQRRTVSLLGQFFASPAWTVFGEFKHQEKDGTGLAGGAFLTETVQLAQPIDYVTNSFEAGAAWSGRIFSARLAYTGSWFTDGNDSLTWSNPYLPVVPGATDGRMALPPANNLQQLAVSGDVHLPLWTATTLTYNASVGKLKQDAAFLPVSTLAGTPTLPESSLDGDVHVSHYALGLSSRPLSRLYVRGTATYDGRDDHTSPLAIPYIVTDTFPGGTAMTPRYGEDRTRLEGSADYRLFSWVRVGTGGKFLDTHFAPGQVLTYTHESQGWGHATFNPLATLSLTVKGGSGRRDASSFHVEALPPNENPLLRAFEYAPRDRTFFSFSSAWELTSKLSWALEGTYANDAYRLSSLGLQDGHERNLSTTLTWAPREHLSLYLNGGYQRMTALQVGDNVAAAPVWQVNDAQRYWNLGTGGRWTISERWDVNLDYVHSASSVDTDILAGGPFQAFPTNDTRLDSLWLNATYQWTPAFRLRFRYGHQKYSSNDWALDNVGPNTVPDLLAFGIQPFRHDVNSLGVTMLYDIGAPAPAAQ
ncbi:MAG TPA: MtrB/PioB family decaheme-associated outer membrane protein [Steroidobacteraceae bacterium]